MAITVTSLLTLIDNADSVGTWSSGDPSLSAGASYVDPKEGTDCVCLDVDVETLSANCSLPGAPLDMSDTHLYCWVLSLSGPTLETKANGGIQFGIGDGTNEYYWYVGGRDNYQGDWQCFVVHTGQSPDDTVGAGNPLTAATTFHIRWTNTVKSKATRNCFWDYVRYGNSPIIITGGTEADPATFTEYASASYAQSIGTARRLGGVTFLKAPIQIGTASNANTYFESLGDLVVWEDDDVSDTFYKISLEDNTSTSFSTSVTFGSQIGSGDSALGAQGSFITTPSESIDWSFYVNDNEVETLYLFGTTFQNLKYVFLGSQSVALDNTDIRIIDTTFAGPEYVVKYITTGSETIKNLSINFASASTSPQETLILYDTSSVDGNQYKFIQGYGFSSTQSLDTETYIVSNIDFSSANKYFTIYENKTWDVINPTWTTPLTTAYVEFDTGSGTSLNEKYTIDITTATAAGDVITGSAVFVYEGLNLVTATNSGSTNAQGIYSDEILKSIYTSGASSISSQSYGEFALKVYRYERNPFVTSLTVTDPINTTVTLTSDTDISSTTSASAISAGTGITLYRRRSSGIDGFEPHRLIPYSSSGATPSFVIGGGISGSTSGNIGIIKEVVESGEEGKLFIESCSLSFLTDLTNGELLGGTGVVGDVYSTGSDFNTGTTYTNLNYVWQIDADGKSLQTVYDYQKAKTSEIPPDSDWLSVVEWGENEQSLLLYADGNNSFHTERSNVVNGPSSQLQGVFVTNKSAGTMNYHTADNNVQYVPPVQYTLTLSGMEPFTEISVVDATSGTEIASVENVDTSSGDGIFTYQYVYAGADQDVFAYIHNINYEWQSVAITLSNSDLSIPIQQTFDRNYSNP